MLGVGRRGPLGRDDLEGGGGPSRSVQEERDAWIVLASVEGVGPVSFERLLGRFGSAAEVLGAVLGAGGTAAVIAATRPPDGGAPSLTTAAADELLALARDPGTLLGLVKDAGVRVLTLMDWNYPARLRQISLPPPLLFVRGDTGSLARSAAVAIVGTRRPTGAGRLLAGRIGEAVATCGATVVSGLALGVDGAAHWAAVRQGVPTVAVIGGGHECLYPSGHRGLADAILRGGGAIVSEYPPDKIPNRGTFPRRNRIISGLADATVVVEAGARSGALTTAAWALEQGRGLHIVAGRPDDPAVAGSLAFLREVGPEARVVTGIADLVTDLGLGLASADQRDPGLGGVPGVWALGGLERRIAAELVSGSASVDRLVARTGAAPAAVLGALTVLEIRGYVVEVFGRYQASGPLAGGSGDHASATGPTVARVLAARRTGRVA